jgi:uncharacterized protein DUF4333
MRRLFALSLALPVVLLGACGGDRTIDKKKAEDLARKIADTGRVRLWTVSCPTGVKAKKDATFDCKLVYAEGTRGTITIHQTDDNGSIRTAGSDIHLVER